MLDRFSLEFNIGDNLCYIEAYFNRELGLDLIVWRDNLSHGFYRSEIEKLQPIEMTNKYLTYEQYFINEHQKELNEYKEFYRKAIQKYDKIKCIL